MNKGLIGARILILFPHMVMSGGAINYACNLAEELASSEAIVGIVTLKQDQAQYPAPPGVEVITLNGPLTSSLWYWLFLPYWQRQLNKRIRAWQPDVIVPQVFPANWWGWLYKKKYPKTRLVWVCQEPSAFIHSKMWIKALTPWWKRVLARILRPTFSLIDINLARYSDATIVNSRFSADIMEKTYGFPPDGIATPGIDFSVFEGKHESGGHEIITVAHLTKFKRVDFLLEVFTELLKYYPDLHYNIVGTGEEESALRAITIQLGIQSQVEFHCAVDNQALISLYHHSCLFLHGSQQEPFGMAPLEAIASGTPVIAHHSGGIPEFINERCGRLIDSSDPVEWGKQCAEYLDLILSKPDFSAGVRTCAEQFDWSVTLKPALEIINEVSSTQNSIQKSFI